MPIRSNLHTSFDLTDIMARADLNDEILDDVVDRHSNNSIAANQRIATVLKLERAPTTIRGVAYNYVYARVDGIDTQIKHEPCKYKDNPGAQRAVTFCHSRARSKIPTEQTTMPLSLGQNIYVDTHGSNASLSGECRDWRYEPIRESTGPGNTVPCPDPTSGSTSSKTSFFASFLPAAFGTMNSLNTDLTITPGEEGPKPTPCVAGIGAYMADFAIKQTRTHVKLTPVTKAAWEVMSQIFPAGAIMTSAHRSWRRQYDLIKSKAAKFGISMTMIEADLLSSGKLEPGDKSKVGVEGITLYEHKIGKVAARKLCAKNYIIGAPNPMNGYTPYAHGTGNAFDVIAHDGSKCHIQAALNYWKTQTEIPIKIGVLWEGGKFQRCFHVTIKELDGVNTKPNSGDMNYDPYTAPVPASFKHKADAALARWKASGLPIKSV